MKTESRIQQEMWMWYKNKYCTIKNKNQSMIAHVANEGQMKLVSIGLLPGFSDLIICHWSNKQQKGIHLYIEVKTPTGTQSKEQKAFQKLMESLGKEYYICRLQDEFENLIKNIDLRENN